MKKTAIALMAILTSLTLLFTACGKNKTDMNNGTTTTKAPAETTTAPETTTANMTDRLTTDPDNAGMPESTSQDSALADAVENAADGVADANERIADGVRDAQNNNR